MSTDTLHGWAEKPPTTPYDPLPICPAEVLAGIDRELRALTELGFQNAVALGRAIAITAAKIRNSPVLAECQAHLGRCHHCGEPLDGTRAEVAVLNPGGSPLHLHAGCHGAHRARRRALVDRIMAAAGYGAEGDGEAA